MNNSWSAKTQKLIELLQEHSYVWNKNDPEYRRKLIRKHGITTIANELDVSVEAVKHKLSNLKTRYKIERQKIDSYKKVGVYYKPLIPWFDDFNELMESAERHKESDSPSSGGNTLKEDNTMMVSSPDEEEDSGEEPPMLEEADNTETIVVSISQEYLDGINNAQKNVDVAPKSFKKLRKPSTRKQAIDSSEAPRGIHPSSIIRDEFQMFAEQIAEQLKRMPTEAAMNLQNNIQCMIDEAYIDTD